MFKRGLVFGLVLCFASVASAGISTLSLEPQAPGPYNPGEIVSVDVFFNNAEGQDIDLRQQTLDFSASDAALGLPGTFEFNTSMLVVDALYSFFETMPKVDMVYTSGSPTPGFIISVPDGAQTLVGTIDVTLPGVAGSYTLDAINAAAPDTNTGAFFAYGFDQRVNLHHTNDNLGGGTVDLRVIPEPATLALLGVGGLALLRRRRTA